MDLTVLTLPLQLPPQLTQIQPSPLAYQKTNTETLWLQYICGNENVYSEKLKEKYQAIIFVCGKTGRSSLGILFKHRTCLSCNFNTTQ